jgi:multidrug resistance efflux pump
MGENKVTDNPAQRVLRVLRRPPRGITMLAWGGAVFAAFHLASLEGHGITVVGYVQSRSYQVASLTGGRIECVLTQLQQEVQPGQVIARMISGDNGLTLRAAQSELARIEGERARTAALLVTEASDRAAQYRAELRRFTADRDQANIDLLRTQALLNEDESRIARLDTELEQLRRLGSDLVAPDKLEEKRLERETLATRIQGHRSLLAEQRTLFERAQQRAEEFAMAPQPTHDARTELAPFDEAIAAQCARIEQLRLGERELELRAPVAGRVAAILRHPGEVVAPGECLITLIENQPNAVVAHLPEGYMHRVTTGTLATLYRHGNLREAFDSVVIQTGAMVEQMPGRTDALSQVPRWGFAVHLACPAGRGILAGEQFKVVFHPQAELPLVNDGSPTTPAR